MTTLATPYSSRLPRMLTIRQRFPLSPPLDVVERIQSGFAVPDLRDRIKRGSRIAIGVGSRGITNLQTIVEAVIDVVRDAGAQPFIVPAMGSHGGATPEGQLAILAGYGVTEAALGVPIEASMDTRSLGTTPEGVEVSFSEPALQADGIIFINRIKPHTDFGGDLGSGLMKMLVVGFGKRDGAASFHATAARLGHARILRSIWPIVFEAAPVVAGVAVVENRKHQTTRLEVVPRDEIEQIEKDLLPVAAEGMPSLPFDEIDLLIIDRIGKNISGTGLDPNVTGRHVNGYISSLDPQPNEPCTIRRLFVRDLTPESNGNAIGIGMADFTTRRLVEAMDPGITYMNCLTALSIQAAKIPVTFDTDREAIARALGTIGGKDPATARIVRIADTLSLETLQVSEACLDTIRDRSDLEMLTEPADIVFDPHENLLPFTML